MWSQFLGMKALTNRPNMATFDRALDRMFDNMFDNMLTGLDSQFSSLFSGFTNAGDSFEMSIDVPGFDSSEIRIEAHEGSLVVSGSTKGRSIHHTASLPQGADVDKISANLDKGVLTLKVPKADSIKAPVRMIPVGTEPAKPPNGEDSTSQ